MRKVLAGAIELVRFPLMTIEEFAAGPAQSDVLEKEEVVDIFLHFAAPNPKVRKLRVRRFISLSSPPFLTQIKHDAVTQAKKKLFRAFLNTPRDGAIQEHATEFASLYPGRSTSLDSASTARFTAGRALNIES
jgi:hypothetical protein